MYYRRIKELREDNDKKQIQIAKLLKITQGQYSKIENGTSDITGEKLIQLCCFYDISADYILGFTNEPKPLPKR